MIKDDFTSTGKTWVTYVERVLDDGGIDIRFHEIPTYRLPSYERIRIDDRAPSKFRFFEWLNNGD